MSDDREEVWLHEFLSDRRLPRTQRRAVNRWIKELKATPVAPRPRTNARNCPNGQHDWFWLQSGHGVDGWCEHPSIYVCSICGASIEGRCGATSMRRCAPCARRHKHRVRKVFESGLIRDNGEHVYWLTLTAPGDDQHWNPRIGDYCECTPVGGVEPAEFNTALPRAWSDLVTYVRRNLGEIEYGKSVEVQPRRLRRTGRALLHLHVLVRTTVDLTAHVEDLRGLAIGLGFGHELELIDAEPRHAAYAAKYASGSVDDRHHVEWIVSGETVRGAPRMRTWTASRRWGSSMRDIKDAEIAYVTTAGKAGRGDDAAPSRSGAPSRLATERVEDVLALLESLRQSSTPPLVQGELFAI